MQTPHAIADAYLAVWNENDPAERRDKLDLVDRRVLLRIATACIEGDAAAALTACHEAGEAGLDAKRLSETLLQLLRDLVVVRIAPDQPELIEASEDERAELRALAERTDATRLRRMFRALVKEQEDLAWAPQPFAVLELGVVRLATMPDGDDVGRLLSRLDALEKACRAPTARGREPYGGRARCGGGKSRVLARTATTRSRAASTRRPHSPRRGWPLDDIRIGCARSRARKSVIYARGTVPS